METKLSEGNSASSGLSTRVERLKQIEENSGSETDDIIVLDPESYSRVATEKRIEMIEELRDNRFESQKQLAEQLGRDVKNVHQDLEILRKSGVIEMEKNGRKLAPRLRHSVIAGEVI
ncbi:MAG: hypothetical protein ABEJ56_04175 [Candidatus Nanohaloarchaea archaeon]